MTDLALEHPELTRINENAMHNEKVTIHNEDAYNFLLEDESFYDAILVDLPDPNNEGLNKLYTDGFYKLVRNHLNPGGFVSIQSTSPLFAREAYWTISETVQSTGMHVDNYHLDIPSFGNWGFTLASREAFTSEQIEQIQLSVETAYLDEAIIPSLFAFGKDEDAMLFENGKQVDWQVNTMNRPVLLDLYNKAWKYY